MAQQQFAPNQNNDENSLFYKLVLGAIQFWLLLLAESGPQNQMVQLDIYSISLHS